MRNKNSKVRCVKENFTKHKDVCRTYSPLQLAFAEQLESDPNIKAFSCNVPVKLYFGNGIYTTDFLCETASGEKMVRECIERDAIERPQKIKLLDASREFWLAKGIVNWGIVIDAE